jgi:hypothetical protein
LAFLFFLFIKHKEILKSIILYPFVGEARKKVENDLSAVIDHPFP